MTAAGCEYLLPDGTGPPQVEAALPAQLRLAVDPARTRERTYYDTFDGRLHARGLALSVEDGRLTLTDAALAELGAAPVAEPPARLLAGDLPGGRLRNLLAPVIDVRALCPIVRVRTGARASRVLDAAGKTVVRLSFEEPALLEDGARVTPLRPRVRVLGVRGYDKALARLRRALEHDLGLAAAGERLHDEAVRADGRAPGGVPSKLRVALAPDQRADAAAVVLLEHLLATIDHNMEGTLADVDSEFLHDVRVAVRRTRALQRELKRVFPPAPLAHFRAEFRRLQEITGPTRDLDVHLLEFDGLAAALPEPARTELEPLRGILLRHGRKERARMVRALRGPRTTTTLSEWAAFLDGLVAEPLDDRPDAGRPIIVVSGHRIARVYHRMVAAGGAIGDHSPPEALHDLRKTGKELRYLLEFFSSLYPHKVVDPMVKTLKALQDTLGRHQDRAIQIALLRSLSDELAAAPGGPAALMAVGLLTELLHVAQVDARGEFADRFAAFASKRQRALVEQTFR